MLKKIFSFCLTIMAIALFGCNDVSAKISPQAAPSPAAKVSDKQEAIAKEKPSQPQNLLAQLPQLKGIATVEMKLKSGTVVMEIDGNSAPITAANFIDLVKRGVYNGLTFHRVVKDPQPFVAQGGDPEGNGMGGFIDPKTKQPRNIPLEILAINDKTPTYSTTLPPNKQAKLRHEKGALAMARSQSPDSASSQFYITLADTFFLDGSYAVFGKVLSGMEAVQKIEMGDRIESIKVLTGIENLQAPA
jgi:peptidyl-prolyl cis-trans isomerase B (cyclophilin B)